MKHLQRLLPLLAFLIASVLVAGCTNAPTPTAALPAAPTNTLAALPPTNTLLPPTATWTMEPSATPDERFGVLTLVENEVQARVRPGADLEPAREGLKIFVGGELLTGADGRAELHLLPEDTIVRVNANSHFVLKKRDPATATTSLKLLFGKIWIILKGGSLDVETPNGVASVRGSIMSVEYYPQQQSITVVCLEGHCAFESSQGTVEMTTGQMISISPVTPQPVSTPKTMNPDEYKHEQEQLESWDKPSHGPSKTPSATKTPHAKMTPTLIPTVIYSPTP